MNIKFCYQYRDAANYKQYNEVIFSNPNKRSLEEINNLIRKSLIDDCWFYAESWSLPDMHFVNYKWDNELDHAWHEYNGIVYTDVTNSTGRNIEDLLIIISALI